MMRSYLYDKTVWYDMDSLWSMFKDIASADSRGCSCTLEVVEAVLAGKLKWSTTI